MFYTIGDRSIPGWPPTNNHIMHVVWRRAFREASLREESDVEREHGCREININKIPYQMMMIM